MVKPLRSPDEFLCVESLGAVTLQTERLIAAGVAKERAAKEAKAGEAARVLEKIEHL